MPSLPILAVVPRIQYVVAGGPTATFNVPFQFFVPTDLLVYRTPFGTQPSDVANILAINANYTVTQNFNTYTGSITLTVPANNGDIITIVRNMPNTRANFYIQGGPLTPDALNTDFESEVLMIQQNNNVLLNITPRYQFTETPIPANDIYLPVLGANQIWAKDPTNTFIEAIAVPNGTDIIIFPVTNLAVAQFLGTAGDIGSANIVAGAGINVTVVAGSITIATTGGAPVNSVTGTANQINVTAGANPVVSIAPNAILPGTGGVTVPSGTTGQRAGGAGTIRFNTTTGFSELTNDGITWNVIDVAGGTVMSVTASAPLASSGGNNPNISFTGILSLALGGTNADTSAQVSNGGIVWSNATQMQILAGTATARQMLQSGSAATPAWSTATWPATTTINQLLYSSGANIVTGLATVNSAGLLTSAGGVPGWVAYTGTGAPVLGTSPTITTPNIVGVTNASSAAAGSVGEFVSSNVPVGSAISLTTATSADVTSINLTAGDWDIFGNIRMTGTGTFTIARAWTNTTSATPPDSSMFNSLQLTTIVTAAINTPYLRVNVNANQTVYLTAQCTFSTGTVTACGSIFARRVR